MLLCCTSKTPKWTVLKVIRHSDKFGFSWHLIKQGKCYPYQIFRMNSKALSVERWSWSFCQRDILRPCCNSSTAVTVCCMKSASNSPPSSGLCPKFRLQSFAQKNPPKISTSIFWSRNFPQGRWPWLLDKSHRAL